ncbi:hypothetical protein AGMMS49991_10700 [Spirochaetia bacterium]|nr:hypothetical protein AGMMS49991_10700 [Spirochaetia bacterium]
MKKKLLVSVLAGLTLVCGLALAGCDPNDKTENVYDPYIGTWVVLKPYYDATQAGSLGLGATSGYYDFPNGYSDPRKNWELKIYSDGKFDFRGSVNTLDTEAHGSLDIDPDESGAFIINPKTGVWHHDDAPDEVIESVTLQGFAGLVNRDLEADGTWKMNGEVNAFDSIWKKK